MTGDLTIQNGIEQMIMRWEKLADMTRECLDLGWAYKNGLLDLADKYAKLIYIIKQCPTCSSKIPDVVRRYTNVSEEEGSP